jgi:hypothetical protein
MKENLIMSTVYNVLMDEGYRPKIKKRNPETTAIIFKSGDHFLMVFPDGDNYIELSGIVSMEYYEKFSLLDLYKLVSGFRCMQVAWIVPKENKKRWGFVLSFRSMLLNPNDVKSVLDEGIRTIAACVEEVENEYFIAN